MNKPPLIRTETITMDSILYKSTPSPVLTTFSDIGISEYNKGLLNNVILNKGQT